MLWLVGLALLAGCADRSLGPEWSGPTQFAQARSDIAWTFHASPGRQITSEHYVLYTTIADQELQLRLLTVMEGALEQYRRIAPGIPLTDRPMPCYIFSGKQQWAEYTQENTGEDAKIYLQINRGGYCVGDTFAAYFLGKSGTPAVAAHEGWHQYVARHFQGRLPPFLEEGIATLFEDIEWIDDLPRWKIGVNRLRAQSLRRAIESKSLVPLAELATSHAGDVVGKPGHRIDTFYAQNWAFALFLWQAENARYRPALARMLADIAANRDPSGRGLVTPSKLGWQPATVPPLLEYYLIMPLADIEKAYLRFVHKIAVDDFNDQWES